MFVYELIFYVGLGHTFGSIPCYKPHTDISYHHELAEHV